MRRGAFTSRAAGRADHGPAAAEAGRHFRPERGKLASKAAAGSGADGPSDRLRRAGSGKARCAVLYQQAVQSADGRRARDGNRCGRARGQKALPAGGAGRGAGNFDHPRNRRSGARQGLSVSARGNFNCRRRHGRDQRHHKSSLPAGRKDVFHDALSRRARHPARHRAGVGPRRSGNAAKILRLHRLQHQRQAHQFRVHRPHRR